MAFSMAGVTVAERGAADAAEQVEIVVTVFVAQVDALAGDEEIGVAFVGLQQQLALCCLDGLKLHATITSVPSLTRVEQRSGRS